MLHERKSIRHLYLFTVSHNVLRFHPKICKKARFSTHHLESCIVSTYHEEFLVDRKVHRLQVTAISDLDSKIDVLISFVAIVALRCSERQFGVEVYLMREAQNNQSQM